MLEIGVQTQNAIDDGNPREGFARLRRAGFDCADFSLHGYLLNKEIAPNTPSEAASMITPARITPSITNTTLFLKSIFRMLAASVPDQAPVPGRGMPTKSRRAM